MTLEKLAHESGTIAKGHLSDIENGRVRPTIQSLRAIADRLDVEILDLVNFPDEGARAALIDATRDLTPAVLAELLRQAQQSPRAAVDGDEPDDGSPFKVVRPRASERYVTCVPLLGIDLAAGGFVPGPTDPSLTWVTLGRARKLGRGMFVARVVGRSMEPRIPDGAWCLFAQTAGDPQGRTLLVQHRGIHDADTGTSYTVKRFERLSARRVRLLPENPDYEPIELRESDGADVRVVAELIDVLPGGRTSV